MPVTRSFDNAFALTDFTQEMMLIPNTWGLINELGIFSNEPVSQNTITIESSEGTLGLITDQFRGARNLANKDDTRKLRSFPLGHYPLDDAIKPEDIQGKRAYGSADAAETEAAVIARKLERIRRNHAVTTEYARAYAICNGAAYAPNGTIAVNYYTDFGITKTQVDFAFGTSTTDMIAKVESGISDIQDKVMSGETINNFIVLCSPGFFSKLISHATVKEAYKYYASTQEPLRNRLGSGVYRRFVFGGAEFIEYRGAYNGSPLITANKAYMIPQGTTDSFVSYYGPANRFSHVNTLGEEAYVWTFRDPKDIEIQIQSESNFLHLLRRPQSVVEFYSSN